MTTMTTTAKAFLTEADLAERWSCSQQWLRNQRCAGRGVTPTYFGRAVRYALSDVEAYEAAQRGFTA